MSKTGGASAAAAGPDRPPVLAAPGVRWADPALGGWIEARMAADWGVLGMHLPTGYPALARVLHPAADDDGVPVTWAEVCARLGRRFDPLMTWAQASGERVLPGRVQSTAGDWSGCPPELGGLPVPQLTALQQLLGGWTPDGARCLAAVWEGHGDVSGGTAWYGLGAEQPNEPRFGDVSARPRLRLPWRDHLLFSLELDDVVAFGGGDDVWHRPPNLLWPPDRSWFLASEIDLDCSLVAGPVDLVEAVIAHPDLEAFGVAFTDRIG